MPKIVTEPSSALEPLIAFAAAHKGTVSRVTARLEVLTGEKCHRQLVEKWLHHDPVKRTDPRMSTGMLLLKIWEEIRHEQNL